MKSVATVVFKEISANSADVGAFKVTPWARALVSDKVINKGIQLTRYADRVKLEILNSRLKVASFAWEIPLDKAVLSKITEAIFEAATASKDFKTTVVFNQVSPSNTVKTYAKRPGDRAGAVVRHCYGFQIEKESHTGYLSIRHISSRLEPVSMSFELPADLKIAQTIHDELMSFI